MNPDTTLGTFVWNKSDGGRVYSLEICDPCQDDPMCYRIGTRGNETWVSDFVHPAWFEPFKHPKGTKFDHLGLLKKPFSMTKGGYVIVKRRGKVHERFASKAKEKRFARENRRGHRSEYRKPNGDTLGS